MVSSEEKAGSQLSSFLASSASATKRAGSPLYVLQPQRVYRNPSSD